MCVIENLHFAMDVMTVYARAEIAHESAPKEAYKDVGHEVLSEVQTCPCRNERMGKHGYRHSAMSHDEREEYSERHGRSGMGREEAVVLVPQVVGKVYEVLDGIRIAWAWTRDERLCDQ